MNAELINQIVENLQEIVEVRDGSSSSCFIASDKTDAKHLKEIILATDAKIKRHGSETQNCKLKIINIKPGTLKIRNQTDAVPSRTFNGKVLFLRQYPMERARIGVLKIFNCLHDDPDPILKNGAANDVNKLSKTFKQFGFVVTDAFQPESFDDMKTQIQKVTNENYDDFNIFAMVILSHGDQGKFFEPKHSWSQSLKQFIDMQTINDSLHTNKSLEKRPKLIFTDSCRGDEEDLKILATKHKTKNRTRADSDTSDSDPDGDCADFADFIWVCSSVTRHVSNSISNGTPHSPWITKLCKTLIKYPQAHLLEICIHINNYFQSHKLCIKGGKKVFQMSDIQMCTLTKAVYFVKKKEENKDENEPKDEMEPNDENEPNNENESNNENEPKDEMEPNNKKDPNNEKEPKDENGPKDRQMQEEKDDEEKELRNVCQESELSKHSLTLKQDDASKTKQNEFSLNQDESQEKLPFNLTGAENLKIETSKKMPIFRLPPEFNCYPMSKKIKGHALILCNEFFDHFTRFSNRCGSDKDRENLDKLFCYLGFSVLFYLNLSASKMKQALLEFSCMDHTDDEMCIIVVMTHGDIDSFFGSDGGTVRKDYILNLFNNANCPTLMGKPKLFLFQSCRGAQIDHGVEIATKTKPSLWKVSSTKVPTWEDMLIVYSSVPGFVSFRNTTEGTWFIHILCKVFMEHAWDLELRDLLDLVMMEMSKKNADGMEGAKQSCAYENRHFYKKLYFNPGLF